MSYLTEEAYSHGRLQKRKLGIEHLLGKRQKIRFWLKNFFAVKFVFIVGWLFINERTSGWMIYLFVRSKWRWIWMIGFVCRMIEQLTAWIVHSWSNAKIYDGFGKMTKLKSSACCISLTLHDDAGNLITTIVFNVL
mgnify:CR=1 FL=1